MTWWSSCTPQDTATERKSLVDTAEEEADTDATETVADSSEVEAAEEAEATISIGVVPAVAPSVHTRPTRAEMNPSTLGSRVKDSQEVKISREAEAVATVEAVETTLVGSQTAGTTTKIAFGRMRVDTEEEA